MEDIIEYLRVYYSPLSVIVYGSYADGSRNAGSDFDALVITEGGERTHDVSFVGNVQLDVFVYPREYVEGDIDLSGFLQIFDGIIAIDTNGVGKSLKERVLRYIAAQPKKSKNELHASVEWCRKMLTRTKRGDAEGMFRWHWVLTESLEVFCDLVGEPYRGPKKSLRWMEREHPAEYAAYSAALFGFDESSLEKWIDTLCGFEK